MKEISIYVGFVTERVNDALAKEDIEEIKREFARMDFYKKYVLEDGISAQYKRDRQLTKKEAEKMFEEIEEKFDEGYPLALIELQNINAKKSIEHLNEVKGNIKGLKSEILEYLSKQEKDKSENMYSMTLSIPCKETSLREVMFAKEEFDEKMKSYVESKHHIHSIKIEYETLERRDNPTTIQRINRLFDFVYDQSRSVITGSKLPGGDWIMFKYPFKSYLFSIHDKLKTIEDKNDYKAVKGYDKGMKITKKNLIDMHIDPEEFWMSAHKYLIDIEIERKKQMPLIEKLEENMKKDWVVLKSKLKTEKIMQLFDDFLVADTYYRKYDNKQQVPKRGFEKGGEYLLHLKHDGDVFRFGRPVLFDKEENRTLVEWFLYVDKKRVLLNKYFKTKEDLSSLEKWLDTYQTQIEVIGKLRPRWLQK